MTYEPSPELSDLLSAMVDDEITPERNDRLAEILSVDAEARAFYCELINAHSLMLWQHRPVVSPLDGWTDVEPAVAHVSLPSTSSLSPGFFNTAYHGTVSFFSQEVPFGILMATLIMSLAGVIASFVTREPYTQMPGLAAASAARSLADSAERQRAAAAKVQEVQENVQWVGRITGMVDCKWSADEDFLPPGGDYVSLGRKYKLDSGLMEITYDTGAKVVLQGPCTYEVDSAAGGYLSLGKLTARVEKRGEGRGEREEEVASGQWLVASESAQSQNPEIPKSRNPSSPAPSPQPLAPSPSALFAVRTPTAVITDLGTEFGVSYSQDAKLEVHVFVGLVDLERSSGSAAGTKQRLTTGQAVRFDAATSSAPAVAMSVDRKSFPVFKAKTALPLLPFTRGLALWLAADVGVVRDNESRVWMWQDLLAGDNRTAENALQPLENSRPLWVADAVGGRPAVRFDGETTYLSTAAFETSDAQTLIVVFAPAEKTFDGNRRNRVSHIFNTNNAPNLVLEMIGNESVQGRVLLGDPHARRESVGVATSSLSAIGTPVIAAYVYSPTKNEAALRLDGRVAERTTAPGSAAASPTQKWIGSHPFLNSFFAGDIAELLLFNADLSEEELNRVEAYLGAKYRISIHSPLVAKEKLGTNE